jgi:hypothetical protein
MAWPTVTIGARTFVVKFNQRAEYLASAWGYDLKTILEAIGVPGYDARRFAITLQLFAACTGHNFTSSIPRQEPLSAEQWADFLESVVGDDRRIEVFTLIQQAVMGAVVKRASDRMTKAAPTPTTEAPAAPKEPVQ